MHFNPWTSSPGTDVCMYYSHFIDGEVSPRDERALNDTVGGRASIAFEVV